MPGERPAFDPADPAHVALYDELPLWSALAGEMLLEIVPLDARHALDLGCGAGFPALELAERLGAGSHVTGIDPWRAALGRAHAKRSAWPVTNVSLVHGDGATLPFRAGAFGLVVSNLGVNNFADPAAALAECARVLDGGGALALATNLAGTFAELDEALDAVLAREGDEESRARLRAHAAHRVTVAGLGRLLEAAGFRVDEVRERRASLRLRDGGALLAHHFLRLGFLPALRDVAGEGQADRVLAALREELDRRAGRNGLALTVPLAAVLARRAA